MTGPNDAFMEEKKQYSTQANWIPSYTLTEDNYLKIGLLINKEII